MCEAESLAVCLKCLQWIKVCIRVVIFHKVCMLCETSKGKWLQEVFQDKNNVLGKEALQQFFLKCPRMLPRMLPIGNNTALVFSVLSCQISALGQVAIGTCFLTLCHTLEVCRPEGNGIKSDTCHVPRTAVPLHLAALCPLVTITV